MHIITQWFSDVISVFNTIQIKDIIDILVITFIIFSVFKLIRETRAEQLLKGVVILFILYITANIFGFTMLTSLMR